MNTTNLNNQLNGLRAYYKEIYDNNPNITDLKKPAYEKIKFLQEQFAHRENDIQFNDKDSLKKVFKLLVDEHDEMVEDGLSRKDLKEFRNGIADQLTIAFFLIFKIDGLSEKPIKIDKKPRTYSEYALNITKSIKELQNEIFNGSLEKANDVINQVIANLYNLPEFSQINCEIDLIDTTLASLTKICTTEDEAKITLDSYKKKGADVHISKVDLGWAIFVTNDCTMKENRLGKEVSREIPKGKFLKSINKKDPLLDNIEENTVW